MRLQRQSNQQIITLDPTAVLGSGGEAHVYSLPQDSKLVIKLYHKPTAAHAHKLAAMLANPPADPMAGQGHASIAWPVDLLRTTDGKKDVVGFLMPRVSGLHPIIEFYNPGTRRKQCPLFNTPYLHRTARNLAAAVRALHARGYVIGDVNESNILVADTTLVTLVDTDSFQVREPGNGTVYRCPVGKPEFTPPELQGKTFRDLDRAPEHDLFGLAVLIFRLLMEGVHPFDGVAAGQGDPPLLEERIKAGHFPYGTRRVPYLPMPLAPPFEILHPQLQDLLVRCFEDGHKDPSARPDAQTWQSALDEAEKSLATCSANSQHRYGNHLSTCPWCERQKLLKGRDPFPSQQAVQQAQQQAVPPTQTPLPPAGVLTPPTPPVRTPTPTAAVTISPHHQPQRLVSAQPLIPANERAKFVKLFLLVNLFAGVITGAVLLFIILPMYLFHGLSLFYLVAFPLVTGAVFGIAQAFVLRPHINPILWAFATVLGETLILLTGFLGSHYNDVVIRIFVYRHLDTPGDTFPALVIGALGVGFMQRYALAKQTQSAWIWPVASLVSRLTGYLFGVGVLALLSRSSFLSSRVEYFIVLSLGILLQSIIQARALCLLRRK